MVFAKSAKFALSIGIAAFAIIQGAYAEEAAERCIPIKSIKRTKIVDDQTIAFYLNNGKIYNNRLPHRCPGLASANSFKYETAQSELCSVDLITALHQTAGQLTPGAGCGLGQFTPTDDPEKKADAEKKPGK